MKNIEFMASGAKKIEVSHKFGTKDERFFMHIHNKYEIYLSLSDGNKFCIGHQIYDVNRNDLFLFNNTDVHKINVSSPETYDRFIVMFSPSLLLKDEETAPLLNCFDAKLPDHTHKISLTPEQAESALALLNRMLESGGENVQHSMLRQRLFLFQYLLLINDVKKTEIDVPMRVSDTGDAQLNRIMAYIRDHCTYSLTLEELSREFYLNKYYLCRMFKHKLGFGITEYVESCRMSRAIPLLRAGLPVSTVALKTGFGSDTYFISTFKKHLGTSPKKYIKEGSTYE